MKSLNDIHFGFVNFNPFWWNFVAKKNSFGHHEMAFLPIKDEICLNAPLQHYFQVGQAQIKRTIKDGEVIHENLYAFLDQIWENS